MSNTTQRAGAGIVYLAGPYTHPDPDIREARYQVATIAAAYLISKGRIVYSPLTMTHPIDRLLAAHNDTLGSDYWVRFDESFMEFCSDLIVLAIDGWKTSSGIRREVQFFKDRCRPIRYMAFDQAAEKGELVDVTIQD
jgi:hypothetical protein